MLKTEKLKKQIDVLPLDLLNEVEKFIGSLKTSRTAPAQRSTLLTDLSEYAADVDLPEDFSKQHDHYLYGLSKK